MSTLKSADAFERMNFLYQASHLLTKMSPRSKSLISFYGACMKKIATKNLLKLDPSIKRTVCKKCHTLLIPGITMKVRTRSKGQKSVIHKCLNCGQSKKYLRRKNYRLWSEQPEAEVTRNKSQPQSKKSENKLEHNNKPTNDEKSNTS